MNEVERVQKKSREEMQLKPTNDGKVDKAIFSIYEIIYYVEWSNLPQLNYDSSNNNNNTSSQICSHFNYMFI